MILMILMVQYHYYQLYYYWIYIFLLFENHIYFYFCDLVSFNFSFFEKNYPFQPLVFHICIWQTPDTHVHGPNATDTSFDL